MKLQTNIYQTIKNILQTARNNAYKQVNFIIVEEEQKGENRAEYGSFLIKECSLSLYTLRRIKKGKKCIN